MIIPSFKHLTTAPPKVYITFDDGPCPHTTQWLTQLLIEHKCAATFFLLGENASNFTYLNDNYNHFLFEVANHGYAHLNGWQTNDITYIKNFIYGKQALQTLPNFVPKLFRAPYGKLTPTQYLKFKRFTHIAWWTLMSYDFKDSKNPEIILERLKRKTKAGTIVVLHENEKSYQNLKLILPQYLQWLGAQGFATGKLSELITT
ncbi:MAG: polysaccharide deacetylase family protein [Bacteroidia bacterium]|nr:polysaccharide deacetylase family protein [Bacteroidia bacterium]